MVLYQFFYGAGEMAQCLGASVSMKTCIQSQHHEETFLELRLAEEESSGEGLTPVVPAVCRMLVS